MSEIRKQYLRIILNRLKNFILRGSAINKGCRDRKLIVSLTTYHKRLSTVNLTIETLMHQSVKPNAIILWISSHDLQGNKLPQKLLRLQRRGLRIEIVSENINSYKKLIYALGQYKACDIITCDDDVFYPYRFIEGLWKTSREFPGAIAAYRCSYITKTASGLAPYLSWPPAEIRGPSYNLFPTGVGGVLYPPGSLNDEVFNSGVFMELAPTADDVWFKFMGLLNNTPVVMVNSVSTLFPLIPKTQDEALWRINITIENNLNDMQTNKLLDKYNVINLIE